MSSKRNHTKIFFMITSIITFLIISILFVQTNSNKQIVDFNYKFDKAIIEGIGEVNVSNWNDYENSDMVQVIDTNGNVYLTHSSNVILIKESR